ncbi:hypothetical protein [Acidovorax sp.]|uniref:hypothetical protein n=1 Tax=Acidovorax sp. TaxID=1872122 RepID=UPI0025831D39|nr:hypothetical protein [Acidovorax sp.]
MNFEAMLFGGDGVLVDSKPLLRDMLEEAGCALSAEGCMALFVGKTVRSESARIGPLLTDAWMAEFPAPQRGHSNCAAAHRGRARGSARRACASGADRFKVEIQLVKLGLAPHFAGDQQHGAAGRRHLSPGLPGFVADPASNLNTLRAPWYVSAHCGVDRRGGQVGMDVAPGRWQVHEPH